MDPKRAAGHAAAERTVSAAVPSTLTRRLAGRYEVLREIGRSPHSTVYAARDSAAPPRDGALLAIKVLAPPPSPPGLDRLARQQVRQTTERIRRIPHPGIVHLSDWIETAEGDLLVMEYVPGFDLAARVRARGVLTPGDVTRLGIDLGTALAAAHGAGILHGNLKPENVLLDHLRGARLTDFGFPAGEAYTAPELRGGTRGDARADIYALGLLLHVALVGALPDGSVSPAAFPTPAGCHPCLHPRGGGVPTWLDDIVGRATAADPRDRFPTMAALVETLTAGNAGARPTSVQLARRARPSSTLAPQEGHGDRCLLCGEPDPLGLAVCRPCGGDAAADALLLVTGQTRGRDLPSPLDAARHLSRHQAADRDLRAALAGHRALAAIPAGARDRVAERLAAFGLRGAIVARNRPWRGVPRPLWLLLGLVLALGTLTGLLVSPIFLWASPAVAGLLALSATRTLAAPVLRAAPAPAGGLDPGTDANAIATLTTLPSSSARAILADILRLARQVVGQPDAPAAGVHSLVHWSTLAAQDLALLDETLDRFAEQRRMARDLPREWWNALQEADATRNRLVHSLLQVVAVLGRWETASVEALDGAAQELRDALGATVSREPSCIPPAAGNRRSE